MKWIEQKSDTGVSYTRHRRLPFDIYIKEYIVLIDNSIIYSRKFDFKDPWSFMHKKKWENNLLRILNSLFSIRFAEKEKSKNFYLKRYSFLKKHYKEVLRDDKLKKLGIT